jgi:hypothetical protein
MAVRHLLLAFQFGGRSWAQGVFASSRCGRSRLVPSGPREGRMLAWCSWTPASIGICKTPSQFRSSEVTLRSPCAGPDRRSIRVPGCVGLHRVEDVKNCVGRFSTVTELEPVPCAGAVRLPALLRVTRLMPSGRATVRTARGRLGACDGVARRGCTTAANSYSYGASAVPGRTCPGARRCRRDSIGS